MSLALFFAIYCLEAGLFFTIIPWTRSWALNPLLHATPVLSAWADNPFARGFVSGFGIVHLLLGIHDIVIMIRDRRRAR
jgi:hypothetical protein